MRTDQVLPGREPPKQQSPLMAVLQQAKEAAAPVVQAIRDASNSHHAAPLHALVRQGARELGQVLPAFPDSNLRTVEETGQLFNVTPQEAFLNKTGRELEIDMGR